MTNKIEIDSENFGGGGASTPLASVGYTFSAGTWYLVDIFHKTDNTWEIHVDGTPLSLDTNNADSSFSSYEDIAMFFRDSGVLVDYIAVDDDPSDTTLCSAPTVTENLISTTIQPGSLDNWQDFSWDDNEPTGASATHYILYNNAGSWDLIPDNDLSGNSSGFGISPVDLSGLDIGTYDQIRLKAEFTTSDFSQIPYINDWQVTYNNVAPSVTFDNDFSTWDSGDVTVNYNLIDTESDTLNISQSASTGIEYSTDNSTWFDATDAGGSSEGLTGLSSSASPGENHVFIWDSATDLTTTEDSTVYLRIRPNDGTADADSWATATAFGIDNLAPSSVGVPSFATITTSSIEISKPSTVTENGSGLYQWQVRQNSTTELGLTNASTTSIIDSSLSENTEYTYDVQFEDNQNNTSNYGTSTTKYTLADTTTNLSLATQSTTQIDTSVDTFPNHSAGFSGYYFENTTASTNSGWQAGNNTWSETDLSSNTQYTYTAKYRNGDGTETSTTSDSLYTLIQVPTAISFDDISVNSFTLSATGTLSNLISGLSGLYFANVNASTTSAWIQTNSWTSDSLSENTAYTFQITSRNGDGLANGAVSVGTKYTLADTPTNLTLTAQSTTQLDISVDTFPNHSVGSSGYYFYRLSGEPNSGWIQTNTWTMSNQECSTTYTAYVKYRNGDGVETDPISLQVQTDTCNSSPETSNNLEGDFSFSVNNNTETITNQIISLKLLATPGTKKMNISNTPNFSSSNSTGKISFQSPYKFNLCQGQKQCQNGNYTIYIKFYDANDRASEIISSSVVLALDHTPPKQPTTTYPTNNSIIKDNQPTLKGATEPKAKIILELNSKYYYSTTADASGNWQYSFIKPLKSGNYTLKITAQDQANNLSKPITLNFIIQTQKASYKQDSQLEKQSQEKDQEQKDQEKTSESEFEIYQEEETEIDKEPEPELEQEPEPEPEPTPEESTVSPADLQSGILIFKSPYGNINLMPNIQDQILKLAPGQTFKAFLRPEKPVKTVKVMIIFEKSREKTTSLNPSFLSNIFSPTLVYAKTWQVAEFILTDEDQDGIFTGEIKLPETTGEYTARATLYYEDGTIEDLETQILIDPKGYIYTLKDNLEARLPKAIISLYYFNSTTNQFELWQGQTYDQQNPQTTDKTGEYEFLVPAGRYYFKITVPNYQEYQSKEFTAQEGEIISQNIELKPNPRFNWKVLTIAFVVLFIFVIGILIGVKRTRFKGL
ncbi:MAG: Ig-like domain-containing protein [Patescibacteria group bacterium]